jgi:predicted nucleotidyltransferase
MDNEPKIIIYEDVNPKIEEAQLFTFKDIEGDQQFDIVEKAGRLLDYLKSQDDRIISISILGSTVKGYAINNGEEVSDLDICLIYSDENPSETTGSQISADAEWGYFPTFSRDNKVEIHPLSEVNMAKLDKGKVIEHPSNVIMGLVFPMFGNVDDIKSCINKIKDMLIDLPDEGKDMWVKRFVDGVMFWEFTDKALPRLGKNNANQATVREYEDTRRKLYEERIHKLFID